jgi:hypothetical protein
LPPGAGYDALDVDPVASAGSERFQDDEVLGGTGSKHRSGERKQAGAGDNGLLERKGSQGNVDAHSGRGAQEQYAVDSGELRRVVDSSRVLQEQSLDEGVLSPETRHQRQVHVHGFARFAPTLNRQTADEAESPAFLLTQRLKLGGRPDELNHGDRPS